LQNPLIVRSGEFLEELFTLEVRKRFSINLKKARNFAAKQLKEFDPIVLRN